MQAWEWHPGHRNRNLSEGMQTLQPGTKETSLMSVTRRVMDEVNWIQSASLCFAEI